MHIHSYKYRTQEILTCILDVVLGSRNVLTVFHKSLNPGPAFTMNIWYKVWKQRDQFCFIKYISSELSWSDNAIWHITNLRIVVVINLLELHNEFSGCLAKILQTLPKKINIALRFHLSLILVYDLLAKWHNYKIQINV